MWMGGRAEGLACTDPEVRIPIGMSGDSILFNLMLWIDASNLNTIFLIIIIFWKL
jgi:hypothetical protein